MCKIDPEIIPAGKNLQARPNPRIAVRNRLEGLSIQRTRDGFCAWGGFSGRLGVFLLLKQVLPRPLSLQGAAVKQCPHAAIGTGVRQQVQLFLRSIVFSRRSRAIQRGMYGAGCPQDCCATPPPTPQSPP